MVIEKHADHAFVPMPYCEKPHFLHKLCAEVGGVYVLHDTGEYGVVPLLDWAKKDAPGFFYIRRLLKPVALKERFYNCPMPTDSPNGKCRKSWL
mmetsp:Transcript_45623/g.83547  ORF Transcript_45623/g.83547 Transcript_45623/m.83547 type:complete len:94 (+) Transcript_45623:233-514(+)